MKIYCLRLIVKNNESFFVLIYVNLNLNNYNYGKICLFLLLYKMFFKRYVILYNLCFF